MSYAHHDDLDRHLTTFRERLSREVQIQTGLEFPIFQDIKDIHWGQAWQERIDDTLDEIIFLIPIVTPSFFKSDACRAELKRFIDREKELGRSDLILPVYFVETDLLSDTELRATDELAELIASRQYVDWRELRFEPFTNPQVSKTLAKLAIQIRDALPRAQTKKRAPAKSSIDPRLNEATKTEGGEQSTEGPTAKKDPPTVIVDPMHRGNFVTISDAIKSVEPGTRILVRRGLYVEGLVIDKPLEIIGDGHPGDVVVQIAGMDVMLFQTTMGRVVNLTLRQMGGGNWYCIDIAQGRLELEDCDITSQSLACVGIHSGADPRLRRNQIHNGQEGGVRVYDNGQGTLEDNDIFGNELAGVQIKALGNPTLRRNRIHHSKKGSGVNAFEGGQGILEDNDIFDNALSGVQIKTEANPILRRNRIHNNKQNGVYVHEKGQGTVEDNDIFDNGFSGIRSHTSGNPVVRNNRVNKNARFGIGVDKNGGGTFEDNDLTENTKGAWYIAADSKTNIKRINNKV